MPPSRGCGSAVVALLEQRDERLEEVLGAGPGPRIQAGSVQQVQSFGSGVGVQREATVEEPLELLGHVLNFATE